MKVQDLMTKEVGSCRAFDGADQGARIMWERDCGAVPVLDPDAPRGRIALDPTSFDARAPLKEIGASHWAAV